MSHRVLSGLRPQRLYEIFEEISAIPRGSGNEKEIADYICAFAHARGLFCRRDALHNVLLKKPGSAGYETHPPVILQGHTDMVCEKNNDTRHDFLREGLRLLVKDGWLSADGTTLGADDGVAVAIMLALLEDETAVHPPLECMFTVQEETGMGGAEGFDYAALAGRTLINLDSETLDVATVSCAGGVTADLRFAFRKEENADVCLHIALTGLAGGHSGADIHKGRANAVLLTGRLLAMLAERTPVRVVSMDGGNKSNAIPRECDAVIAVPDAPAAAALLAEYAAVLQRECGEPDRGLTVSVCETAVAQTAFSAADTARLLRCVNLIPNGVLTYSPVADGLVESSSSLGIIRTAADGVTVTVMPRASVESRLEESILKLRLLAAFAGAEIRFRERHPGWEYAPESRIRDVYMAAYAALFGREARAEALHAGLECGIINRKLGGIDAVSIGPEMHDIHTPNERLNLQSFADAYALVGKMLAAL